MTGTESTGGRTYAASGGSILVQQVPLVDPFPLPGTAIRAAMHELQLATVDPPKTHEELERVAELPRPWDPATFPSYLRQYLWLWLDQVAIWVNEQHLWSLRRPGIPACWPEHPHVVHDLAVLACARYFAAYADTPAVLVDWQQYNLPSFLDRLEDRLGDGCSSGEHQPAPRTSRGRHFLAKDARTARSHRYDQDLGVGTEY